MADTLRTSVSDVRVAAAKRFGPDGLLLLSAGIILGLGLILVYSASASYAARNVGDTAFFLRQQATRALMGLGLLLLMMRITGGFLSRNAPWIFLGAVFLCVVVLIPGIGYVSGGARRWIDLGFTRFQPSEVAKLAVVIAVAAILARRESKPKNKRAPLLVPVALSQIPVALILAEPDLGTALVIELIVGAMVFAAGLRMRALVLLGLAALPVFYSLVVSSPWRLRRLLSYVDPWAYRDSVGYQITEALISMGSGGVWGVGLGEGKHGQFFLPEAHTDFIFAILGQELGLVGIAVLLVAFGVLLWRGSRMALRATCDFDRYLAVGLTAAIGIPAVFNVCVVTGLLPTKGLPLPLVSFGGSNLMMTLGAIGMLLRIGSDLQKNPARAEGRRDEEDGE